MRKRMPYDDPRAVQRALQARPGQPGIIVPGAGVRDDVVKHVCPECGGRFQQQTLVVVACEVCHGEGVLTTAQLAGYESALQAAAHEEERHNGTR